MCGATASTNSGGRSMPSKRPIGDDDDDWSEAAAHTGLMGFGSIHDLRHNETKGRPFEPKRGPLGFDITPGQSKPKRKRKK